MRRSKTRGSVLVAVETWGNCAQHHTVLPAAPLPAALLASQDGVPLALAVTRGRRPPRDVWRLRLREVKGAGLGLDSHLTIVDVDGERRAGAAGDGGDAQRLEGLNRPGVDVDGAIGDGR